MRTRLLQHCYQLAARSIFKPWLLLSLLSLVLAVGAGIFLLHTATELLLMPCVLAIWLLFALAFRLTFGCLPWLAELSFRPSLPFCGAFLVAGGWGLAM